jgi:transposase
MLKQRRESRSIRTQALNREVYDSSTLLLKSIAAEIKRIEKEMATFAPETQKLLQTIPGVGKVSSMLLVAHIGDITRFDTPEKLVAYIGLDPRVHQSGTSVHGKGYISKRGNNQLRTTLFQAAFMARQKNPQFKKYFDKKIGEGKHYTSALVAIERKLVHLIFAVWTRGTPYEERTVTE